MDKDFILNKWVPALRSGKYKQGMLRLRTREGEYCCLGVACDVADPRAWSKQEHLWCGHESFLPKNFGTSIFGSISDAEDPQIVVNGKLASLSVHNDFHHATFNEIADGLESWVEEQEAAA